MDAARGPAAAATAQPAPCSKLRRVRKRPFADFSPVRSRLISSTPCCPPKKDCEQITFNAAAFAPEALRRASPKLGIHAERRRETAEAAEEKCPKISQRCSASSAFIPALSRRLAPPV